MFTGIVETVGTIRSVAPLEEGLRLDVEAGGLDFSDVKLGDSIALNGCCLTVVAIDGATLSFDVSAETLRCTRGLDAVGKVNLEKAMRLSDRLGGHLVSGHVDGVGVVTRFESLGESSLLEVEVPDGLQKYLAAKGSITINGVSLTVNHVEGRRLRINLIPHTLAVTTLQALAPGREVNVEVDMLARYVERLLAR